MALPFASLYGIAEARLRNAGQRLGRRAALMAAAALAGLIFLGFALMAATAALAERYGLVQALAIMAGVALVLVLVMVGLLAIDDRRARRLAMRRQSLDQQVLRAAAMSAAEGGARRMPSRAGVGLGLVLLGALLVLARRGGDDADDHG